MELPDPGDPEPTPSDPEYWVDPDEDTDPYIKMPGLGAWLPKPKKQAKVTGGGKLNLPTWADLELWDRTVELEEDLKCARTGSAVKQVSDELEALDKERMKRKLGLDKS